MFVCFEDAVGDRGVDIICEMLACKNLKDDIPLLARNGRIIVSKCYLRLSMDLLYHLIYSACKLSMDLLYHDTVRVTLSRSKVRSDFMRNLVHLRDSNDIGLLLAEKRTWQSVKRSLLFNFDSKLCMNKPYAFDAT